MEILIIINNRYWDPDNYLQLITRKISGNYQELMGIHWEEFHYLPVMKILLIPNTITDNSH